MRRPDIKDMIFVLVALLNALGARVIPRMKRNKSPVSMGSEENLIRFADESDGHVWAISEYILSFVVQCSSFVQGIIMCYLAATSSAGVPIQICADDLSSQVVEHYSN